MGDLNVRVTKVGKTCFASPWYVVHLFWRKIEQQTVVYSGRLNDAGKISKVISCERKKLLYARRCVIDRAKLGLLGSGRESSASV